MWIIIDVFFNNIVICAFNLSNVWVSLALGQQELIFCPKQKVQSYAKLQRQEWYVQTLVYGYLNSNPSCFAVFISFPYLSEEPASSDWSR